MSALRQQMQADMAVRGLAPRTQKAYIDAVAAIARHYHRSPDTLSVAEIEQYLHHLIVERQRSWSTTNQAVCALRFLFHVTLKQPEVALSIPMRRAGSKQPEILSRDEVARILNAARQPMHRTLLMTAYAAGLRVGEACRLRCADIDADRMMVRVASGKGNKDRYTLLSKVFRAKFLDGLAQAREQGRLQRAALGDAAWWQLLHTLRWHDWVVYAKQPLGGPAQVLAYLGRYTHRVAISSERLAGMAEGMVTFRARDNARPGKKRLVRLPAQQFIGRFLQHVLPPGFKRIRHYGILASGCKHAQLARCRQALRVPQPDPAVIETVDAFLRRVTGRELACCPHCGQAAMRLLDVLAPRRQRSCPTGPP
jgi:hypothetical protein